MTHAISLIQAIILLDNKEVLITKGKHKKSKVDLIRKTSKSVAEATELVRDILGNNLPELSFSEKVFLLLIELWWKSNQS